MVQRRRDRCHATGHQQLHLRDRQAGERGAAMNADWLDGAAERDAATLAFKQERAWEQQQASRDPRAWAAWARRLLSEASPVAAEVIEHGLTDPLRPWQLEKRAREQAEESRRERLAGLDS